MISRAECRFGHSPFDLLMEVNTLRWLGAKID
jgi:hypothetical protein